MKRPSLQLAVEINKRVRTSDEWFDEPDELDRVDAALRSISEVSDPLNAAAVLAYMESMSERADGRLSMQHAATLAAIGEWHCRLGEFESGVVARTVRFWRSRWSSSVEAPRIEPPIAAAREIKMAAKVSHTRAHASI